MVRLKIGKFSSRITLESGERTIFRFFGWFLFLSASLFLLPRLSQAQVSYVARFSMEKDQFLVGEPIFCDFTIKNTGMRAFVFAYRFPSRSSNQDLAQEPRFLVTDAGGQLLPDPAPQPCGGAKGSEVYGSVMLPPGQTHRERWLVNQWAHIDTPGHYRVRAERRLPIFAQDSLALVPGHRASAYALAIDELNFQVLPSTETQLVEIFQPYLETLRKGTASDAGEAALVITSLPQPFLLPKLAAMAGAPGHHQGWDSTEALDGLARLDTRRSWETIVRVASGAPMAPDAIVGRLPGVAGESVRAYAIRLLGEKADPEFLPPLLDMVSSSDQQLRGEILQILGFFHDSRANRVLFERLHSSSVLDRVNAILGLKNLDSRDAIPAILAMLNDPDGQVRQVAHFALESLTGVRFKLSAQPSRRESSHVAKRWHRWWREHGASFVPQKQASCHDW